MPTVDIEVGIASELCEASSIVASDTQITCTLADDPQAGDWDVEVSNSMGLVPIDQSIALISVDLIVDSIDQYYTDLSTSSGRLLKKDKKPAEDLNLYGGDELYIEGSGFSSDLEGSEVEFEDNTKCKVKKSKKKYLECEVEGFEEDVVQVD